MTLAQNKSALSQAWLSVVEIEGLGFVEDGSGYTYRFCTAVPGFAPKKPVHSTTNQYRPYLTQPIDILAQEAPEFGGIPSIGSVEIEILDFMDMMTGIQGNLPAAAAGIAEDIDDDDTSFDVDDGSVFSAGDQIHLGAEALVVDSVSTNTLTVQRAQFGTDARSHKTGENVYSVSPFIIGRRATVYLLPIKASSWDEKELIGEFVVSDPEFVDFNVWRFHCRSQLRYLNRYWPKEVQQWEVLADVEDTAIKLAPLSGASKGLEGSSDVYTFRTKRKEVIRVSGDTGGAMEIQGRAMNDTDFAEIKAGDKLTRIITMNHIEGGVSDASYSPGTGPYAPVSNPGGSATLRIQHFVDLILSVMVSQDDLDGQYGENYNSSYGNWSLLPAGFGLGIPHTKIDWPSWLDLKERTTDHYVRFWDIGEKRITFSEWVSEEFLEPIGAFVTIKNGKIGVELPRMPYVYGVMTPGIAKSMRLEVAGASEVYYAGGACTSLSGAAGSTVSFWLYREGSSTGGSLFSLGRVIGSMHYYIREASGGELEVYLPDNVNDSSTRITSTSAPLSGLTNQWIHICIWNDMLNDEHKILVNNVEATWTQTGSTNDQVSHTTVNLSAGHSTAVVLGAYFVNPSTYTGKRGGNPCRISEITVIARALTSSERDELYNSGVPKIANLYSFWSDIENYWRPTGSGTTVNDLGNGSSTHNLSILGGGASAAKAEEDGPTIEDGSEAGTQTALSIDDVVNVSDAMLSIALEGGGIEYSLRGDSVITQTARDFAETYGSRKEYIAEERWKVFDLDMFRGSDSAFLERTSTRVLFRWSAPGLRVGCALIPKHVGLSVGDVVSLTLNELPDGRRLSRGLTSSPFLVVKTEPDVFQAEVRCVLVQYGPPAEVRAIAPSGYINAVSSNTATLDTNRYTSPNHNDPTLPLRDSLAFVVGDRVRLLDFDGSLHAGTAETISSIEGDDVELSGNFSGSLATGKVLELAEPNSSDPRLNLVAYLAADDETILSSVSKLCYWGEI